jgi:glycosyltransferase involved in cell wall biosynthesis
VMRTAGEPARRSTTATGFDVGFLGRLHEKKRVGLLIDAVAAADRPVSLVIGGNHPPEQYDALRQHAAGLAGPHRVEFAGFVPADRKTSFFDGIGVLAMPSQYECFGMVAAEAMANGTPVIVSRTSGVADVVDRHGAGAVIATDDGTALRAAIERFVASSADERDAMGRRARAAAEAEFSFEAYGRTVLALYRGLLR